MPYNYPTAFYARHRLYILPQINLYKTYRKKNRTHRRHSSESYASEIYDTALHSRHISVVPAKKGQKGSNPLSLQGLARHLDGYVLCSGHDIILALLSLYR